MACSGTVRPAESPRAVLPAGGVDDWMESTMSESTQPAATGEETSPTAYAFCSWHQRFAGGVRLIDVIEQGSGPGGAQYACGPCRKMYGLVPFADR